MMSLFKWLFFITAFFLVIFTILANMGGSNETLQRALEQYLSEATGYHARIHKLNNVSFFPVIRFDFEDATLHLAPGDDDVIGRIGRAKMGVSFWSVLRRTGRVKDLEIEALEALPGVILPKPVDITRVFIAEMPDGSARLQLDGRIGAVPVKAHMGMAVFGTPLNPSYGFANMRDFDVSAGRVNLRGLFDTQRLQPVINDITLSMDDEPVMEGELALYKASSKHVNMRMRWMFPERGSVVSSDAEVYMQDRPRRIAGTVTAAPLNIGDVSGTSRFTVLTSYMEEITGYTLFPFLQALGQALYSHGDSDCAVFNVEVQGYALESWTHDPDTPCESA